MRTIRSFLILSFTTLLAQGTLAMAAGEIRWTAVNLFTYEIEAHLYNREPFDRPSIELDLGDGNVVTVPRSQLIQLEWACHGIRYNTYQLTHTYSEPGSYHLSFQESGRGGGIINIPNSITQGFCVVALLVIDSELGPNSSIHFFTPIPETFQEGMAMLHDPGIIEFDGDSLDFELVTPFGVNCDAIPGYSLAGALGSVEVDPDNGVLTIIEPMFPGELAFAIKCTEWRNGQIVGQVTRDMGICVTQDFFTGVQEERITLFSLRPTLTEGFLYINNPGATMLPIEILTVSGSVVMRTNIPFGEHAVSLDGLASGVHVVSATDSNGILIRQRIVVQ